MKYNRFVKYTGVLLAVSLFLTGCEKQEQEEKNPQDEVAEETQNSETQDFGTQNEDNSTQEEEMVQPPEESKPSEEIKEAAILEIGVLNADSNYLEEVPMGETCRVDLNNDGRMDTITYKAVSSDIAEYGTTVETFTINDGDYKYTLYLSNQGIHIQDPDLDRYYITDINTRDAYKEIAILDHGANGIPLTYFIRFVGSGTYCLGYVPYFPDDENFKIKGDGSIESALDLKLLQNWQAPALWLSGSDQMLSSNLSMRTPDLFYPYEDQNLETVTQLKDLKLYPKRSLKEIPIEAKASDSAVTFTQTDNEHWVYLKREDGVEGWLYMENADTIVSGTAKYNRRDVFKNLL